MAGCSQEGAGRPIPLLHPPIIPEESRLSPVSGQWDGQGSGTSRYKGERCRIDAVSRPGWWRPVVEDVSEVRVAPCAQNLGPLHPITPVVCKTDIRRMNRRTVAWPSSSGIELIPGRKEVRSTTDTTVDTCIMEIVVGARERRFGPFQPGHAELLGRKPLLPFFAGQGHPFHGFKPAGRNGEDLDPGGGIRGIVHAVWTLLLSPV